MTDAEANRLIEEWKNPVKPFGDLKSSQVSEAIDEWSHNFTITFQNGFTAKLEDVNSNDVIITDDFFIKSEDSKPKEMPLGKMQDWIDGKKKEPWYKRLIKRLKR